MTAKGKIAVTLPVELIEKTRTAVREGRASSVSAYVADSLRQRSAANDLDALLAEMLERSGGPLTDAERARVDEATEWRQV